MKIVGAQGKVIFLSKNAVRIVKVGAFSANKEKVIPLSNVTGVDIKEPGHFYKGYIQIQTAGQTSPNNSNSLSGGIGEAVRDENSVLFEGQENYKIALSMQKYILNYSSSSSNSFSSADEIEKFKQLLDDGTITKEEFDMKKRQLLEI